MYVPGSIPETPVQQVGVGLRHLYFDEVPEVMQVPTGRAPHLLPMFSPPSQDTLRKLPTTLCSMPSPISYLSNAVVSVGMCHLLLCLTPSHCEGHL